MQLLNRRMNNNIRSLVRNDKKPRYSRVDIIMTHDEFMSRFYVHQTCIKHPSPEETIMKNLLIQCKCNICYRDTNMTWRGSKLTLEKQRSTVTEINASLWTDIVRVWVDLISESSLSRRPSCQRTLQRTLTTIRVTLTLLKSWGGNQEGKEKMLRIRHYFIRISDIDVLPRKGRENTGWRYIRGRFNRKI